MEEKHEHHHDEEIKIFVNGREHLIRKRELTYEEVVALAYSNPNFEEFTYKVTFFRADSKHEGVLTKGEKVEITKDMEFTVIRAIRS
jgi:Multiubiquitin